MGSSDLPRVLIVVPDGLAKAPDGRDLPEPSFVYRQVLEYVARVADERCEILLAPGDRFCSETPEHEAGFGYLDAKVRGARIDFPRCEASAYVDTLGNAVILRTYLQRLGRWPLGRADLVCANLHSYRAEHCFKALGYRVRRVHRVPYRIEPDAAIVDRLWYYRYRPIHAAYELAAFGRDLFRNFYGGRRCPWHSIW